MNGKLRFEAGMWVINAAPHVALRLKRWFAKIGSKAHGDLKLKDTPDVARDLQWFCERFPLELAEVDRLHLDARASAHREREQLIQSIVTRAAPAQDFEMALPPRDYQSVAAELCLANGALLCCDELGVGKTAIGIAVATIGRARMALVVTEASLQLQWQREFRKFAPQLYTHILTVGSPYALDNIRMTREERARFGQQRRVPDVLICTYAKLGGWAEELHGKVKFMCFDEVQSLRRGTETNKGAAAAHVRAGADYALGLTATPVYNQGDEIFEILDILKPGVLGTKGEFLEEWVGLSDPNDESKKRKVRSPKALGAFLRSEGVMLRRKRKDVKIELPQMSRIIHRVDADEKPLEDVREAALRLAQVVLSESNLKPQERMEAAAELSWRVRQATGISKARHVADMVRLLLEGEKKLVLFGWHREVYNIWLHRLKDFNPVLFTGSESPKQKDAAFQAFVKGNARVLIMSLRSGSGLDGLQEACSTLVFGELDWSPGVHEQCEGRLDRPGQKSPVAAIYMTSDTGSDPVVEDALREKLGQLRDIRDPDGEVFEDLGPPDDRIKRLAEFYLSQVA